ACRSYRRHGRAAPKRPAGLASPHRRALRHRRLRVFTVRARPADHPEIGERSVHTRITFVRSAAAGYNCLLTYMTKRERYAPISASRAVALPARPADRLTATTRVSTF